MFNWLLADCEIFGLAGQNWMPVFGAGLLLYVAILIFARRRQPR